jgi:hypothetical protein
MNMDARWVTKYVVSPLLLAVACTTPVLSAVPFESEITTFDSVFTGSGE